MASGILLDLLLDGVTDNDVLREAKRIEDEEIRKALEAIARGDFEEITDEELD